MASMSRAHFRLIADAFRDSYADHHDPEVVAGIDVALANVADALATTNPLFRRETFLNVARETRKVDQ